MEHNFYFLDYILTMLKSFNVRVRVAIRIIILYQCLKVNVIIILVFFSVESIISVNKRYTIFSICKTIMSSFTKFAMFCKWSALFAWWDVFRRMGKSSLQLFRYFLYGNCLWKRSVIMSYYISYMMYTSNYINNLSKCRMQMMILMIFNCACHFTFKANKT